MSDGATTPTSQPAACTNCTEQDTITIAGKTFCANCGTPQTAGNSGSQSSSSTAVASPSLNVDSHAPSVVTPSEPMPLSSSLASSTDQSAQAPTVIQSRLKADQLDSALSTEQSPSIAKFSSNTPQTTGSGIDTVLTEERSASEFTNLDDKSGESVMSDETLDELAKAADEPMPKEEPVKQAAPLPDTAQPVVAQATGNAPQPSTVDPNAQMPDSNPTQSPGPKSQTTPDNSLGSQSAGTTSQSPVLQNNPPAPASSQLTTTQPTSMQPAATQSGAPQSSPQSMPRQSNYRLDLTQAGASSLPKAVSDIRPAASSIPPVGISTPAASPVSADASPASRAQIPGPQAAASPQTASPVSPQVSPGMTGNTPVAVAPVQPNTTAPQQPAAASVATSSSAPATSASGSNPVQPAPAPAKGLKASSVALSLVGLLLIGGYIWQVNYPNLALKVAGSKAGISANFPGYIPNGWKLSGNIQSSPGNISYNIANNKNGTSLQVSESKTEWDSQALAENYVAPKASNYLALQAQGLTIYLYDGNQASWVNNGTWYRIEGSASGLSQDQIIKVATSL